MSEQTEPTHEAQKSLVQNKLLVWQNTLYDAQLDAQVAKLTEDNAMLEAAQRRIKQAIQAVELMKELQEKLNATESG